MKKAITLNRIKTILVAFICLVIFTACTETAIIDINYAEDYIIESKNLSSYSELEWESSDESIAVVNNGTITGAGIGAATITALNNGKIVAEYTVNVKIIPVTGIVLSTNSTEITDGESIKLSYSLFPDNASDYGITWRSADESVAAVDEQGCITAIKPGQTTISVSNNDGIMATCSVTVKERPAYDRLSTAEKNFVNAFIKQIDSFKNPDSVKIKGIYQLSTSGWYVKVSGQNGFGGTTVSEYNLTSYGIYIIDSLGGWPLYSDSYNLDLVNEAIQEKR